MSAEIFSLPGAENPKVLFGEMIENDSIKAAVVFWVDEAGFIHGRQAGLDVGDMARVALEAGSWALNPRD